MSDRLTDDLISLIFNAGQMLKEKARVKAGFHDCSFLHIHTLHYIKNQQEVTMKELAGYLHITPPSATSLANQLVDKGFLARVEDAADRRTTRLAITASGLNLLKDNLKKVTSTLEENINKLTATQKKDFITILTKISQ